MRVALVEPNFVQLGTYYVLQLLDGAWATTLTLAA